MGAIGSCPNPNLELARLGLFKYKVLAQLLPFNGDEHRKRGLHVGIADRNLPTRLQRLEPEAQRALRMPPAFRNSGPPATLAVEAGAAWGASIAAGARLATCFGSISFIFHPLLAETPLL